MNITRGRKKSAKKIVIYGPSGIGKSTLAAQFPDPLFIDTEYSTVELDVARFDKPSSWEMLLQQVQYVQTNPDCCKTLVIDTADWAEKLEIEHLCSKMNWTGLEDAGYGKGYQFSAEEFGRLLDKLSELIEKGINVVITAHAQLRKIELPDEMGEYDHWEMKTSKKVAPLIKEWSDALLFCNYKTIVVNVDGKGAQKGKNKAQGGRRVMYTSHHPCWDAKNRYGLPEECEMSYEILRPIVESGQKVAVVNMPNTEPEPVVHKPVEHAMPKHEHVGKPATEEKPKETVQEAPKPVVKQEEMPEQQIPLTVPKALRDLMVENHVGVWDIQNIVYLKGYYPADTPIEDYDPDFVAGVLVGAWPQVFAAIQEVRAKEEIPFN